MLAEFTVSNLGTVSCAKLEFSPGLTVITGETGTGKSMLLTGLKLLTGGRADAKMVRNEAARADVDAIWTNIDEKLLKILQEKAASLEAGELYMSRYVETTGKSRLTLAGKNIPTSSMSEITDELVEIHGQSDQLKLKDSQAQRHILDSFGGKELAVEKQAYTEAYKKWCQAIKKLQTLEENSATLDFEKRYREDLVQRYEALAPEVDEISTTEKAIERLSHLEDITTGLREALSVLLPEEGESPMVSLNEIYSTILKLSKYDNELNLIAEKIDKGVSLLEPALDELESYADSIDLDSLRELHNLEDRLQELKSFSKPFGGDLNKAIEAAYEAKKILSEDEEDFDIDSLKEEVKICSIEVEAKAKALTKIRTATALELSSKVNYELAGLAMKGTEVVVTLEPRNALSLDGAEDVIFMASTHGKNLRPIAKAASGGELSRIMLALEVVTAAAEKPKTFVFDEVDSGIGGATAIEVGKRLAELSLKHQVIVVSHLPQVAAFSDVHYVVEKDVIESEANTTVTLVVEKSKVKEIARMLSGLDSTESGLAHAEDLLSKATELKNSFNRA